MAEVSSRALERLECRKVPFLILPLLAFHITITLVLCTLSRTELPAAQSSAVMLAGTLYPEALQHLCCCEGPSSPCDLESVHMQTSQSSICPRA